MSDVIKLSGKMSSVTFEPCIPATPIPSPAERYLAGLTDSAAAFRVAYVAALALGATHERAAEIAHDAQIESLKQSCRDAIDTPANR